MLPFFRTSFTYKGVNVDKVFVSGIEVALDVLLAQRCLHFLGVDSHHIVLAAGTAAGVVPDDVSISPIATHSEMKSAVSRADSKSMPCFVEE